jgi:hypothetical protein
MEKKMLSFSVSSEKLPSPSFLEKPLLKFMKASKVGT